MRASLWIGAVSLLLLAAGVAGWLDNRTRRYDDWIELSAARHELDFNLVKALIYEESWFRADARGGSGEVGLMQITPAAARDFAGQRGFPPITEERLLAPDLNIEVGCWYLGQSVQRYRNSPSPVLFALLRYNAGETRADAWLQLALENPPPQGASPEEHYLSLVDFPRTRAYAQRILSRHRSRNFLF